jgi:RHS repeat-associated protein
VFSTAHEIAQTQDLERFTVTEYVNRCGPDGDYLGPYTPSYLVGKPARVEHYGVSGSSDVLLARVLYFYDGEPYKGLGYPGTETAAGVTIGRLSCQLALAFTDDLLANVYPANTGAGAAFDASGHYLSDGAQQYVHVQRCRYDARGMQTGSLDPNGNEALFEYDALYGLFPVLYTDAARHPLRLTRGSLPFQVAATLDANGNTVSFTYDPSGLPASKSVQGKFVGGDWLGDPPEFPTELYTYDFTTTPCKILLETRQQRLGATFRVVRYVDGLGRTIQERQDAEPDPATGNKRFRVTDWQVFNHKGLVVRAYQPVFADSDAYEEGDTTTAFVEMLYDPLGRPVRIDYPDDTFETTTFDPWVQVFFDRNDNAGHITDSDPRYGGFRNKLKDHLGTPKRTYVDALGRMIAEAEDNGSELHVTRKVLDLKDQVTEVWDARDLTQATWTFVYDFMGRSVHTRHTTALGDRYALADAAGNPIWQRDARGLEAIRAFDALNRPLSEMTRAGAALTLRRQWRYIGYDENAAEFAGNQSKNLFHQVEEERDADGMRYFEYDWRGLVTQTSHRFWSQTDSAGRAWDDPDSELWTLGADWDPEITAANRDRVASYLELPQLTDPITLAIVTKYDAAGRPTDVTYPEGMATRNSYNQAGLLEKVEVDRGAGQGFQIVVEALGYNAFGQLTFLKYGNGVETTREYDDVLARLTRIFTRRPYLSTSYFQDLGYGYDPVGNPMEIIDHLSDTTFKDNRLIPNTRTFAYDPRYRLIEATGKKHRSVRRKDTFVLVPSPDPNDYQPYTIRYAYDAVGDSIRNQEYSAGALQYKSDRIDLFNGDADEAGTFTDPAAGNFRYDECGNTTHTPRLEALAYTHDNQLRYANLKGGGQVHYFRHGDQRVLRIVKKNGVRALTAYLVPFEYHLRKATTGYTKLMLQLLGQGRHAQAERILAGSDPDSLPLFFHHADHLGSGHVLTKDTGDLLSQEEYFPYGSNSDRRDARNRYRYIGVERDEDTRLDMTGPRTYDCVSGRFLQPDPLAASRFDLSPYVYASATPLHRLDDNGYADGSGDGNGSHNTGFPEADNPRTGFSFDSAPEVPPPRPPSPPRPSEPGLTYFEHEPSMWDHWGTPLSASEIAQYVNVAEDMNLSGPGYRRLASDFEDTVGQDASGTIDALNKMWAEYIISSVEKLRASNNISAELAEKAVAIYGERLDTIASTTKAARAAVEAGLDVAAEFGGKKVLKAVPVLGAALVAQQAKEAYEKGEYTDAALLTVGIVYEPIVWGYMIADARVAWQQHQAAQTSASIDAELAKLQNLDAAKLSSDTAAALSQGPSQICHW